ncbi:MAG: rhodanese-like domain-containing protein [Bacteroidales bacterium]|nr:rhodanese-like domain-containing protein [Bacteroidales bacterium]
MKTRAIITIIFLGLGLIIAAVPQNTTHPYKLTADELLEESYSHQQYYSPDEVADLLVNKDPSIQLIDLRSPNEYDKFHLPGAINIPLQDILSDEWRDYIDQDVKINIFYSNGSLYANKAWMITRQLGFENNYVLEGGLNYWVETIMNPLPPASTSPDEELAKYDFRKGANMALGGQAAVTQTDDEGTPTQKPEIKRKPKKQRVQGGC